MWLFGVHYHLTITLTWKLIDTALREYKRNIIEVNLSNFKYVAGAFKQRCLSVYAFAFNLSQKLTSNLSGFMLLQING